MQYAFWKRKKGFLDSSFAWRFDEKEAISGDREGIFKY
jgi:hypothetical protein